MLAAALLASFARSATAGGDASGTLAAGGTATGDISRTDGETDRIDVELVAGATLSVALKGTFRATVVLTDPDGAPVALGLAGTGQQRGSIDVARGGTYRFAVASADGSQGVYKLVAKQTWPRSVTISGNGTSTVDVGMPAGGKLGVSVSGTGSPEITGLLDPNGLELLNAPVLVHGRAAKLPATTVAVAGIFEVTVTSDGAWTGRITRHVPRMASTRLHLENGLDAVSFRNDGVAAVFSRHCASCHEWASSYSGVRRYAFDAIARMTNGVMPPGGGLSGAEIALVRTWITTGRKP
jgi:hypothetical protein